MAKLWDIHVQVIVIEISGTDKILHVKIIAFQPMTKFMKIYMDAWKYREREISCSTRVINPIFSHTHA